jgi:signal transduction histidine kinase/CheY-like chemotaxis protein
VYKVLSDKKTKKTRKKAKKFTSRLIGKLKNAAPEVFDRVRLEVLIDKRTEELNRQNSLMSMINAIATILLEPDADGGMDAINRSMKMICRCVDVDRVFLWKNFHKDDGRLHYKQVCKWMRNEYAMGDNLLEYTYDEAMPGWKNMLLEGKSINGPLDTLPGYNHEIFSLYTLKSVLIVPLFVKGEFWGFVSFDDCRKRRFFPEADECILRSWGMLVVGAIQRGEIMHNLQVVIKEARKISEEAERTSEAKSHFIANMSHEMRTPMNAVVGLTDLMLDDETVPVAVKEMLKKINSAGETLMGFINDVLDISKIEAGKLELLPVQYNMASLLNDIITLNLIRAQNKPIALKLNISEDLPSSLFGDDLRVKQILNNLLSNAFKYTKEGTITLGVDWEEIKNGELGGASPLESLFVTFAISDTGIGIRKEDIDKLFSDYNQVDTRANRTIEGTGLGLSITKKFVELMGGEISVESEYGTGTTFRVRIRQEIAASMPIGKETVESLSSFRYSDKKKRAQSKLLRPDLSYAHVLVVDDFSTNLDVAAGMLRKYKIQVDCVTRGQDAIDRIASQEPPYDAVFMDHMMPGMDGVEATAKIRALGTKYAQDLPIIALTANAVTGTEQMFLTNGFNAFLSKPLNVMSLDAIVRRWIEK